MGGDTGKLLPRVSTFAIGPYCNHFFLKQLALIGRGQFDVAFRPQGIQVGFFGDLDRSSPLIFPTYPAVYLWPAL